jgi:hypothetical protein
LADLSILSREQIYSWNGFWLRDQRGIESSSFSSIVLVLGCDDEDDDEDDANKNAFNSAKRGMKAFDEFRQKQSGEPASSFSLRRSAPNAGADERNQTGILTSASNLIPPSRCRWLWNL